MQFPLVPFFETNNGFIAFVLAVIVVPLVSKFASFFATASLLDQIEDVHSHDALIHRYQRRSVNWYEKGIVVTLNFFDRVYGAKKFSPQAFVTSMQIAIVYFWVAAVLAAAVAAVFEKGIVALWKVEILLNSVLAVIAIVLAVKLFRWSGSAVSIGVLALSRGSEALAGITEPLNEQRFWRGLKQVLGNVRLQRIVIALSFVVAYHFFLKWIDGAFLKGTTFFDEVGSHSLVGYFDMAAGLFFVGIYMSLGFRFIVEAGAFYPLFGAVFAVIFFKNDHSMLLGAVFVFLVYPTMNAVFDFISIGATRTFLTKILREKLHFLAVLRNLTLDLCVAVASFAGFIASTLTMVSVISVFVFGMLLGADVKTVRSMDPVGLYNYADLFSEPDPDVLLEPTPRSPTAEVAQSNESGKQAPAATQKTLDSTLVLMAIIVCIFGATTFAPSIVHFLIVCSNNYSQRTKSWSSAVDMIKTPPAQISKAWANDVLSKIRRGYLWGWSAVLWAGVILAAVIF